LRRASKKCLLTKPIKAPGNSSKACAAIALSELQGLRDAHETTSKDSVALKVTHSRAAVFQNTKKVFQLWDIKAENKTLPGVLM